MGTSSTSIDIRSKLSILWVFVLFNMIFRDLHQFANATFMQELVSVASGNIVISESVLLVAGIVLELLFLMVVVSRLAERRINRPLNVIAPVFFILVILSFGITDLDDIWFVGVEIIALLYIAWTAWQWKPTEQQKPLYRKPVTT